MKENLIDSMNQHEIDEIEQVRDALDQDAKGSPFKDFCDYETLMNVCNTLLVILDSRIPNWQKEITFDEDGVIEEPQPN